MQSGDIVLQKFGKLLKGTFREGDILGRIGGDEFRVIMKNIQTKDIAMKKAGELLAKTQAYRIDELKGNNISISIGISTAPQDGDCYMDLYKRADQALYQAKRSGKYNPHPIIVENAKQHNATAVKMEIQFP